MDTNTLDLRSAVQAFVRRFGLLTPDRTPCGQPLSVSEAHALMTLSEWERRDPGCAPTLKDLRALLALDKSNVTRVCQRLERSGMLRSRPSPTDGRAKVLQLTAKGRRRAETVDGASRATFDAVLEQLDDPENVLRALADLTAAVQRVRDLE